MTAPIAILGAGPSGLALGRLLEVAGIDYIIFERDKSEDLAFSRGGTLDLHVGSGQFALQEAGLFDDFKSLARYDATSVLADASGKVHVSYGEDGVTDRPEIDRKDLRALLLKSIPTSRIRWGKRVQEVEKTPSGSMSVSFIDGSIESGFRLVIGADGAWSKARSLVTRTRPQYSGLHYLTTSVRPGNQVYDSVARLAGNGNYAAFGEEKQVAAQKLGDGSYYIAVGLRLPEGWISGNAELLHKPAELRNMLVERYFATWPQMHTDIIKHSEGEFRSWPLYAMPTESLSWPTVPGVTLIGDAAHVTTPFVGEGVNCALFDSVQLAQQIVKCGLDELDRAISEYEQLMFPRAIDLIERSAKSGALLFAPDSPQSWLEGMQEVEQSE